MAKSKRDSLRELQTRLADRLTAARAEGEQASWLAVEAGDGRYLLPLSQAGEIFPFEACRPVPHTRPWFQGVTNLRGGLSGVVDFAAYVQDAPSGARSGRLEDRRLVAFNPALEINCVLLIDRLAGLRGLDAMQPRSQAGGPTAERACFAGVYEDADGRVWQEVDLQALSRHAGFLSISE